MMYEQHGEEFARRMILDASISMENDDDAKIAKNLGSEYVEMVKKFTGDE
ncbi:hypothetical protein [Photobacterium damselae]|nr:hypothetical protein [Photobacterium damselae]UKA04917.1 hypothetical protein IHC89_21985 [Photobacterium damselae subsp. damselae]